MEEKRAFPLSNAAVSPAPEPASSRRRGATPKRKANALNASNYSSTPSKCITRDKALLPQTPPFHNGPLTRARQIPTATASGAAPASASAAVKHSERWPDSAALAELLKKQSEWEAMEAAIEAQFEAVGSRDSNAHVVPNHCGGTLRLFWNPSFCSRGNIHGFLLYTFCLLGVLRRSDCAELV